MQYILRFISKAALALALCSGTAWADWTLDNSQSALYFVSIKKDHIAETHTFKTLSGLITSAGQGSLNIDLASVSTHIDIRDQRIRDHLFETQTFTNASISVDLGANGIKPGIQTINASVGLHGMKKDLAATVAVTEVGDSLHVATVAPIVLNAEDFALTAGLTTLREMATLTSISNAVPVTFFLTFTRQAKP